MGLMGFARVATVLGMLAMPALAAAQDDAVASAVGTQVFFSTDSDDTTVVRIAGDFDLRNDGDARRLGVRLENAWYEPLGGETEQRQRIFVQAGDRSAGWTWAARVGTDGHDVIGAASVYDDSAFRKEFFIERDVVETPLGLEEDIFTTFAGAAIDLPLNDRNIVNLLVGYQDFTGDNERYHVRGNFIHVISNEIGLSAQLRAQYYYSTQPGEFDYFSPENYVQVLPVLQLRRFSGGWQFRAVGGIGAQNFTGTDWQQANFAQVAVEAPVGGTWSGGAELTYTDTPGNNAVASDDYNYFQARFSLTRRF